MVVFAVISPTSINLFVENEDASVEAELDTITVDCIVGEASPVCKLQGGEGTFRNILL